MNSGQLQLDKGGQCCRCSDLTIRPQYRLRNAARQAQARARSRFVQAAVGFEQGEARTERSQSGFVHKALAALKSTQSAAAGLGVAALLLSGSAYARWEGVNKPELLPKEFTTVIDVAGFLTDGEEKRLKSEVESLERDKGIKLRVLAQNYPETPGLAVKNYWNVDDMTIVFVADTNTGNLLNFNVGSGVDLLVPRNFWSRLAGKFGNKFYWQEKGQGEAITNTVSAIDTCAREPISKNQCSKIQGAMDEEPSSGRLGKFFFNS